MPLTLLGCVVIARKIVAVAGLRLWPTPSLSPLLWGIFSLFLMAKMGFNTRISHYGFYLAMPAAVFILYCLFWLLPRELSRFDVRPFPFRLLVVLFLSIGVFQLVRFSNGYYQNKTFNVGERGDRILAFHPEMARVSKGVQKTVEWVRCNTLPSATLAVFPEGLMINYLSRRANPTRFLGFTLPEIQAHGEGRMLAAYVRNPPDYVVLVHRDSSEYGVKYFGLERGFGYETMAWVRRNYSPVWQFGEEPLQTSQFGIRILVRNAR